MLLRLPFPSYVIWDSIFEKGILWYGEGRHIVDEGDRAFNFVRSVNRQLHNALDHYKENDLDYNAQCAMLMNLLVNERWETMLNCCLEEDRYIRINCLRQMGFKDTCKRNCPT